MSDVVIGDILPRTQATAIGGQTVYGTNWTANYESDVVVYSRPAGSEPNDFLYQLSYPSDFSVAFIGAQEEVQVTLVNPSTLGDIVTIIRQTPANRTNLYSNTNFIPSMLNNDFGILTLVDQQAQLVNQLIGPRYNYCSVIIDIVDTILPILGPSQVWAKNAANTAIEAVQIGAAGSGYVNPGLINQIAWYAASGTTVDGLPTGNDGVLKTDSGGVPSISSTLPSVVQSNITVLGTQSQALNMGTHLINNVVDPSSAQDAATKNYVDTVAQGLNVLPAVYAASTTALTVTYSNGSAGVGATLTNAGAMAAFSIDSVSPPLNSRILIKDQSSALQNGIYTVTTVGSGAANWVLTRATDYDTALDVNPGDFVLVNFGTVNTGLGWVETATVAIIGTDAINFSLLGSTVYARKGANSDITSMSGLTGYLQAPLGVKDSNGNFVLVFSSDPAAVNYIGIGNNNTGEAPGIFAGGTDSNVDLGLYTKSGNFIFADALGAVAPTLKLYNAAGSNYTGLKVATAQATTLSLVLPAIDGTADSPLITDASGNLSFLPGAWVSFAGSVGATGFTGALTILFALYKKIGKTVFISMNISGTSNATGFTITNLPYTAARTTFNNFMFCVDNSLNSICSGNVDGTTLYLFHGTNSDPTGWTNAGTKGIICTLFYETT